MTGFGNDSYLVELLVLVVDLDHFVEISFQLDQSCIKLQVVCGLLTSVLARPDAT